jgi:serine/threonine protein kinase
MMMQICFDQRTATGCGANNRKGARFCRKCGRPLAFGLQVHEPDTKIGAYRIIGILGYGGSGVLYEAENSQGRGVALKESFEPAGLRRFTAHDEGATLSTLQHPHLPRYEEIFEFRKNSYLVMELVSGQNLYQRLTQQGGILPEAEVLGYALELSDALIYLHRQSPPFFHGDIKPANLRLQADGTIKLVDLGAFRLGGNPIRTLRRAATPAYAPLELWGDAIDARSDIYSLAATLYHLLTGQPPLPATFRLTTSPDPLQDPWALNPNLTPHVAESLMVALSLLPEKRFQEMTAFKEALIGQTPQPPEVKTPTKPFKVPAARPTPSTPSEASLKISYLHQLEIGKVVYGIAFSPDCQTLAVSGAGKEIELWDITAQQKREEWLAHNGILVKDVAFSPDGTRLASGGDDNVIRVWDVATQQELHCLQGHGNWISSVIFSHDGSRLGSCSFDKTVRVWNPLLGQEIYVKQTEQTIQDVAFSPDGRLLAQASYDKHVHLHDLINNQALPSLQGHEEVITSLDFNHDGTRLASGSWDQSVRVWDISTHQEIHKLTGHSDQVTCVAISPDGKLIASGSYDETVRLWDLATGSELQILTEHQAAINCLAFSPDGKLLASGSVDETVQVWQIGSS